MVVEAGGEQMRRSLPRENQNSRPGAENARWARTGSGQGKEGKSTTGGRRRGSRRGDLVGHTRLVDDEGVKSSDDWGRGEGIGGGEAADEEWEDETKRGAKKCQPRPGGKESQGGGGRDFLGGGTGLGQERNFCWASLQPAELVLCCRCYGYGHCYCGPLQEVPAEVRAAVWLGDVARAGGWCLRGGGESAGALNVEHTTYILSTLLVALSR